MTDVSLTPALRVADAEAADRSYVGLAKQIYELIAAGDFGPGARLPSERTLAERFGVSRTQVREAIIALEVRGAVEVRVGSGIYVAEQVAPLPAAFELPRGPGPIETLRARALIEAEIAALAATERKDADLDRLFAALRAMRENMDDKAANEAADRDFHLAIAEASGNAVLRHMVAAMWDSSRADPLWRKIEEHFHTTALRAASQEEHQRIFTAIMTRDAAGARAAMQAHLTRVIGEFTQAWR
ncbi:FCD domain-containing protein [Paraburkholderia sp. Ac-20347]|jgi:GntR family transcriptional regulator, uxu operon transcriptional repressor|uniref:FadR/GntR family transcriptional regulator n=1 Tax=Paraburkholderia sp. Ac-20347 TaxID=2703892 RepID=UPI00197DEAC4|nr:FCD domain-containing protein [Paraburkholderia sp. Ac-20347]MBN3809660.1 FadR family transcriptional regulator [Paraburkholderia sp. Ac-20347]